MKSIKITKVGLIALLILIIPLLGNLFINGWNWNILDFIIAGIIIFIFGIFINFLYIKINNPKYRFLAIVLAIGLFLLIWAELAVDAFSRFLGLL